MSYEYVIAFALFFVVLWLVGWGISRLIAATRVGDAGEGDGHRALRIWASLLLSCLLVVPLASLALDARC